MTYSNELDSCYLHPLSVAAVAEFAELVRPMGPREAGRRLGVSGAHVCNIVKGRRRLFQPMMAKAKMRLKERTLGRPGFVRLVSSAEWQREHGESYEQTARRRGWLEGDEDLW